jgi:predicted metal-dependent phosphoesterase TrpH
VSAVPPGLDQRRGAWRGAIHLHSRFSFDSVTSPARLLAVAERASLDFVLLTDHDTIAGARALRAAAAARGSPLVVPNAAEYATDHGDLIAAFVEWEIRSRVLDDFVREVRDHGGLILLPHPFHQHRDVERLVALADLVEVHNGRIESRLNARAAAAAAAQAKPAYYASDAHLARHATRVLVEVESHGSLRDSIAGGNIRALRLDAVGPSDLWMSQVIKGIKHRDARLLAGLPLRGSRRALRSALNAAGHARRGAE